MPSGPASAPSGPALLGMVLFDESTATLRLACIGLIVAGILGLKLVTAE